MSNRSGFTLIETLVAMMILAISFVVIMQLFSGGLKSNRVTSDYIYGIFHAKEKLDEILLSDNLAAGDMSGDFDDGYEWTASVKLIEPDDETVAERMPVSSADVTVDVRWRAGGREKHYALKTMTLVVKPKIEGLGADDE